MTKEIEIKQTAASGVWSFNTEKFTDNVYLEQIIFQSATSTTTFDFYVLDKNSNLIFDTRTEGTHPTGILRREVIIPLVGIHTIGVANSDADEAFTGKLVISERI